MAHCSGSENLLTSGRIRKQRKVNTDIRLVFLSTPLLFILDSKSVRGIGHFGVALFSSVNLLWKHPQLYQIYVSQVIPNLVTLTVGIDQRKERAGLRSLGNRDHSKVEDFPRMLQMLPLGTLSFHPALCSTLLNCGRTMAALPWNTLWLSHPWYWEEPSSLGPKSLKLFRLLMFYLKTM